MAARLKCVVLVFQLGDDSLKEMEAISHDGKTKMCCVHGSVR